MEDSKCSKASNYFLVCRNLNYPGLAIIGDKTSGDVELPLVRGI